MGELQMESDRIDEIYVFRREWEMVRCMERDCGSARGSYDGGYRKMSIVRYKVVYYWWERHEFME